MGYLRYYSFFFYDDLLYMNGDIDKTGFELDEAVCICSGTTKRKIIELIHEGCDLDTVSRKTGAYSGCGGCEFDLELLFEAYQK